MEPERWQQIERIYHEALDSEPHNRAACLRQLCGTDESLLREVEGLLALEERAQEFIETSALEIASQDLAADLPRLSVGQTFDRYRILALEGEGGMGVVYTAHDSRLGRTVALKFLLDEFTDEPESQERLRREARTLSLLNHPNICTIYDVGEAQGRTFIAMEHVAGKTLDRLIESRVLPLNEVLEYAGQIADGLAKAHAAGIIHRDLKPGNIMVTDDGHVKLLDFGLAKHIEFGPRKESANSLAKAPSTVRGMIAGTVAYMSPEQALGKKLDARSDIFSFGAVLYEMILRQRAFSGESHISTMSAILHSEPAPLSSVSQKTPHKLERIVARCLQKDPESRFQNGTELKAALQEIKNDGSMGTGVRGRRRISASLIAACAVLLTVFAVSIGRVDRSTGQPAAGLVMTRFTSDSGLTANPVISRDGRIVAYASDRSGEDNLDIWVQQVASGPPIRLTSNRADEIQPDFSPDGSKVVFRSGRDGGGIYVISSLGGEERLIVASRQGFLPRFSPDGNWIAYSAGASQGPCSIYVVNSTGGPPRELKIQIPWGKGPIWSPDGKHLMFLGSPDPMGFSSYEWWVAPAEGGQAVKTGALADFERNGLRHTFDTNRARGQDESHSPTLLPRVWSGDRIIFSASLGDSTNLWQVAINPRTWQIKDPPKRLTTGSGREFSPSLAVDGRLVFATVDQHLSLWKLPIHANAAKVTGKAEVLTRMDANNSRPSLSADGRKLVFVSDRTGNSEIWVRDFETGKENALTETPWDETHPYIAPDGSKILYQSLEKPHSVICVLALEKGIAEKFCDDCGLPMAWSPDGRKLFFHQRDGSIGSWRSIDVITRQRKDVIRHLESNLHMLRLSYDGKWLAFHQPMGERGRSSIIVAPLRNAFVDESEWVEVTDGTGVEAAPWWSPDGGILYFLSRRDGSLCMWSQHLDKSTKRPVGAPLEFAHFHGAGHRVQEVGFGPGVGGDKLIFTMNDTRGNVWMTNLQE